MGETSSSSFLDDYVQHKHEFGEWLNIEELLIEEEVNATITKMLLKYEEYTEGKKQEWTLEDKKVVLKLYEVLKEQRNVASDSLGSLYGVLQ